MLYFPLSHLILHIQFDLASVSGFAILYSIYILYAALMGTVLGLIKTQNYNRLKKERI